MSPAMLYGGLEEEKELDCKGNTVGGFSVLLDRLKLCEYCKSVPIMHPILIFNAQLWVSIR